MGQEWHCAAPVPDLYVPATQASHVPDATEVPAIVPVYPASHEHCDARVCSTAVKVLLLTGQFMQDVCDVCDTLLLNVSTPHAVQAAELLMVLLYVPVAQAEGIPVPV